MEEVFLSVLGGDEAEAAVGDDLLDGTGGHNDLLSSRTRNSWRTVSSRVGRPHGAFATMASAHHRTFGRKSHFQARFVRGRQADQLGFTVVGEAWILRGSIDRACQRGRFLVEY
jgi:hypothetical protein